MPVSNNSQIQKFHTITMVVAKNCHVIFTHNNASEMLCIVPTGKGGNRGF